MNSPIGALIERKRREEEYQQFNGEAAIAYEMAYIIQLRDFINMMPGVAVVFTEDAKKVLDIICREALEKRQIEANGFAMERNREIVSYMDKIDELNNQIHNLEQRLSRREAKKKEVEVQEERHTPIPDHASASHA